MANVKYGTGKMTPSEPLPEGVTFQLTIVLEDGTVIKEEK